MTRTKALAIIAFAVGAFVAMVLPTGATDVPTNTNDAPYWSYQLQQAGYTNIHCYKYGDTGSNSHGGVYTDENGKTYVELNEFQDEWPGDQWVLLVVKGGSVNLGHGPGNAVYYEPDDGIHYFAPSNDGDNQADVSHWIVCKGTVPDETTTTSTSTTSTSTSTTTTEVETTTTTEAETTTTSSTVPEETTTTSTTVPEETTTTSTTVPETTTTTEPEEETTTTEPAPPRRGATPVPAEPTFTG